MHFIKTKDNTQLYIKDWGKGRPVIFIHGWPLTSDTWDSHALAVAKAGYRAITYDRRGFGRSSQPWSGYDYDTFADDVAEVMAATDARDATLVGFSMGGGEVARFMSRYSGRNVVQTVLVSSIVPFMLKTSDNPNGVEQGVFDQIVDGIKQDRPGFYGSFFKDFYGVSLLSQSVSSECLDWTRSMAMQGSLKATLDCVSAFGTTDFRDELSSFTKPTLIVHGTADKTVPIDTSARAAAKGIPQAILKEYERAPHGLTVTHQEQLTTDLLHFLKS
jgi:non-heme chloroperoxidase